MHQSAFDWVSYQVKLHGPFPTVIELGSLNINGSVRRTFRPCRYIGVDIVGGPDVDVVKDAALYRPKELVDCVVCCEVLEHSDHAGAIVENAITMLKPGGWLIITCAGPERTPHSGVDGLKVREGEFYLNVQPHNLVHWLEDLVDVDVVRAPHYGDLYAVGRKT